MVRAVRRNLHHKPVLPELAHQRRVFAHRVKDNNAVTGGKEHVHKLTLSGEGFPGARHSQIQAVGVL